ncbi:DUF2306 domain-containing protein [Sphingobium yanoikuyae]|uniref:DUF2306 domain-containing protein n=1 Tax=Sphingobium yanoikuyae TaxID=13690 RepID=UPI0028A64966|nr:DUF2306 domain-containing protein [Sphingobium yanoikuyae]
MSRLDAEPARWSPATRQSARNAERFGIPAAGGLRFVDRTSAEPTGNLASAALRWSARLLVVASWASGAIFATYIIAFFGGAAIGDASQRWNGALPGLYDARSPSINLAIGAHFLAGGVLLLLGPIQLIGGVRRAVPWLHRGLGRIYVLSAGMAGLGGLAFIVGRGTIGGVLMDVGFGLYGALTVLCATMAYLRARSGRYERHRVWAIRLFALTIGSWLYRMEYGLWSVLFGGLGRGPGFSGWFDAVMVFFFYAPNLFIAELFIRAGRNGRGVLANGGAVALLLSASIFIVIATWMFTASIWGPRILAPSM